MEGLKLSASSNVHCGYIKNSKIYPYIIGHF